MKHPKWLLWVAVSIILGMAGYAAWHHWMSPTRILVVNALEAQQADFVLNNDSRHIKVTCMEADEMHDIDDFDAIIVYAGVSPYMSSGTVNTMLLAINDYRDKYPNREFVYVDSQCISNGQATFLEYLAKYNGDDIETYAHDLGKHIVHLFTERDVEESIRQGLISSNDR